LINQIFRSPFTKFIIPYAIIGSYLFTVGLERLISIVSRTLKIVNRKYMFVGVFFTLVLYAFPVFQGYFFSQNMKVILPNEYLQTINFFNKQDSNKRIALLPEYTFWGWFFHNWGYSGSGFLWYGIKQPIVSRTFDVWSTKSESYFWEMKLALESEDASTFEAVLEKYNIDYLIVDNSLLPVSSTYKGMQGDRNTTILQKSKIIQPLQIGKIVSIYKVSHPKKIENFISIASQLPNIGPIIQVTNQDSAYLKNGDYISSNILPYAEYYPFLDIISQTRIAQPNWQIDEDDSNIYLKRKLDSDFLNYQILHEIVKDEYLYYEDKYRHMDDIKISLSKDNITVAIKKNLIRKFELDQANFSNCTNNNDPGVIDTKTSLIVKSSDGANICFSYVDNSIEQRYGYLIKIKNSILQKPGLFFYVKDKTKEQVLIEDRLKYPTEYYVLPLHYRYGVGYDFTFQNTSFVNMTSANRLDSIEIYSFPYNEIKSLRFVNNLYTQPQYNSSFETHKSDFYLYEINAKNIDSGTVILNQAFHGGWGAYISTCKGKGQICSLKKSFPMFFGKELKDHVLVNNWANGWKLNRETCSANRETCHIIIIFWPQYLEYLGFGLLVVSIIYVIKYRDDSIPTSN